MRGGARQGAGRPRRGPDALEAKVTLRLTRAETETLQRHAALHGKSVSDMVRGLVLRGLSEDESTTAG